MINFRPHWKSRSMSPNKSQRLLWVYVKIIRLVFSFPQKLNIIENTCGSRTKTLPAREHLTHVGVYPVQPQRLVAFIPRESHKASTNVFLGNSNRPDPGKK